MTLTNPERQQIRSAQQQVHVRVDTRHDWVEITDREDANNSVFLQGDEAYEFIQKAESMYEEKGDISLEDARYFFAWDYFDVLLNS